MTVSKDNYIHEAPDPMRRIPQQDRSRRVVDDIVDAAHKILDEHGRDALSTTSLEYVSNVPKSTVYEYFPNLDSVVSAVFHKVIRHYHSTNVQDYPLSNQQTVKVFLTSVIDWILMEHSKLFDLDAEFYLRYSDFFDLWLEFDDVRNQKNATSIFIEDQLKLCSDYQENTNDQMLAEGVARSLLLTICVMLRESPDLLVKPEFRNMLIRMACAIVGNKPESTV